MELFLASFLVFCLAVLGMAVGALAGRPPLEGGCGRADCSDRSGIGCGACGGSRRAGP
jgi:hypothetical protein